MATKEMQVKSDSLPKSLPFLHITMLKSLIVHHHHHLASVFAGPHPQRRHAVS